MNFNDTNHGPQCHAAGVGVGIAPRRLLPNQSSSTMSVSSSPLLLSAVLRLEHERLASARTAAARLLATEQRASMMRLAAARAAMMAEEEDRRRLLLESGGHRPLLMAAMDLADRPFARAAGGVADEVVMAHPNNLPFFAKSRAASPISRLEMSKQQQMLCLPQPFAPRVTKQETPVSTTAQEVEEDPCSKLMSLAEHCVREAAKVPEDNNNVTLPIKKHAMKKKAKKPPKKGKDRKPHKRKPLDMPRRPLSAYNLFFAEERRRIINESATSDEQLEEGDAAGAAICHDISQTKARVRLHRKSHGRVSFKDLTKIVAAKWKSLPRERMEHFQRLSDEDRARQKRAVEEYHAKQKLKDAAMTLASDDGGDAKEGVVL